MNFESKIDYSKRANFDPYFQTLLCHYKCIKECYEHFRETQIQKLMDLLRLPPQVQKIERKIQKGLENNENNYTKSFFMNLEIVKYQQEVLKHIEQFQSLNSDPESKSYFTGLSETIKQRFSNEDSTKQTNYYLPIKLQDNFANYAKLSQKFQDQYITTVTKQIREDDQYNLLVEEYFQSDKYLTMEDTIQDIKIKMRVPTPNIDPEDIVIEIIFQMVSLVGHANYNGVFFGNLNPRNIYCKKIKDKKLSTPLVQIGIPNIYNLKQVQFLDNDIKPESFQFKIQGMIIENKCEVQYVSCTKTLPDINSMIKIIQFIIEMFYKQDIIFFDEDDPVTRENFSHDKRKSSGKLKQLLEILIEKQQNKQIHQIDQINMIIILILEPDRKKFHQNKLCPIHNEPYREEEGGFKIYCLSCFKQKEQQLSEVQQGQYEKIINKNMIKLQQFISTKSYSFIQLKKKLNFLSKQLIQLEQKKGI